ncbi:hypothetical protein [Trebonia sp.]|uniref:hypothetical protein n=1 Tax=Trebonia sp. TaxID=2767075 RepID=UPI00260C0E93|nr:hypothetical protein [Trebonia sp.]
MSSADRQLAKMMPLHAITSVYGQQGLRVRFAAEATRLLDEPGWRDAERALWLAGELHAADRRQHEPYVNHLLRVAVADHLSLPPR